MVVKLSSVSVTPGVTSWWTKVAGLAEESEWAEIPGGDGNDCISGEPLDRLRVAAYAFKAELGPLTPGMILRCPIHVAAIQLFVALKELRAAWFFDVAPVELGTSEEPPAKHPIDPYPVHLRDRAVQVVEELIEPCYLCRFDGLVNDRKNTFRVLKAAERNRMRSVTSHCSPTL